MLLRVSFYCQEREQVTYFFSLERENQTNSKSPQKVGVGLNIFYFISHEKGLVRAQMLYHSPLPHPL